MTVSHETLFRRRWDERNEGTATRMKTLNLKINSKTENI